MKGFNPETDKGDNQNLIRYLGIISENCKKILAIIAELKKRNDSNRLSLNVENAQTAANAISAAATGFLTELTSKISIEQRGLLEADISALTAEIMTLKELLGRQEVNIDEVQAQVERVQKIVDNIKRII